MRLKLCLLVAAVSLATSIVQVQTSNNQDDENLEKHDSNKKHKASNPNEKAIVKYVNHIYRTTCHNNSRLISIIAFSPSNDTKDPKFVNSISNVNPESLASSSNLFRTFYAISSSTIFFCRIFSASFMQNSKIADQY